MAAAEAWERQAGESAKAHAAFEMYRDLGAQRSLQAVSQKLSKSIPLLKRWSAQWDWVARAEAYDLHLAAEAEKVRTQTIAERERAWALRREAERYEEWELATELRKRAREMLAYPLAEQVVEEETGTIVIKPLKWNLSSVARILDLSTKLARLSAEMDEDHFVIPWDSLTEDQLARIANGESPKHVLFGS